MKKPLLVLPLLLFAAGCMDNSTYGTGINSSGGAAGGTITQRNDGKYALVMNVGGGVCSAVYSNPKPDGTELRPLVCSNGKGGNATVIYDKYGNPARGTYGGVGIGSGTITF